jgi:tetratricopeptide (TPR) repeat protein
MDKRLLLSMGLAAVVVLSGCTKKLGQFSSDFFNVNPSPLETVGDRVPATVTGQIPSKFLEKNAEVTITPYLVYNGQETVGNPMTVQGEKVRDNNQIISYDNGGTITIPVSFAYQPDMQRSNLQLGFNVTQGKNNYALPRVKVADGILSTSTLADAATVTPCVATDSFQRVIKEKYNADIKFLINQTNIRASELKSGELSNLHKQLKEAQRDSSRKVEGINISSYASPEGGVDLNTKIASGREKNTQSYLNDALKKNKVNEHGDLTADFTAQDWDGFQKLVSQSNIQDKDLILSVLSMYKDPAEREKEIRNMSSVFDQLAKEVLPKLRYSRLTATVNVIGKSDEEIMKAFDTNPKSLTVDELLYCATLTKDNDKKMAIYNTCINQYPNDYRAYNDLGMCQYIDKDYEAAEASFKEAAEMNPNSSEAKMNLGLVSMLKKNYSEANERLGSAAGAAGIGDALGTYYLKTGDNNAAVRAFADSKTNNAALAQILTKDYSSAKNTLTSITTPDATTYYLLAVLGARTNNDTMVYDNLRQAVKLDSSMKAKATNDLEFAKFNLSNAF